MHGVYDLSNSMSPIPSYRLPLAAEPLETVARFAHGTVAASNEVVGVVEAHTAHALTYFCCFAIICEKGLGDDSGREQVS